MTASRLSQFVKTVRKYQKHIMPERSIVIIRTIPHIKNSREDDVLHFANRLPDIHFTFSIFHFQFKISVRASLFSFLRNYLLKLTAAVYCTVTVIVTLDVLLSTSLTEYVTLYLPFRVVTTLPKTSIFDVMSLPQVSTAVTPARA